MASGRLAVVALVVALAGCVGESPGEVRLAAPGDGLDGLSWGALGALVYNETHLHSDREEHVEVSRNLSVVAASTLGADGRNLGEYTEADVENGLLAVAVVTGQGRDLRIVLLDEAALPEVRVLGTFDEPLAYGDVKLDDQLPFAYVPYPGSAASASDPTAARARGLAFSIWDITEPAAPRRVGEARGGGCHMLHPMHVAGAPHVWCASLAGPLAYRLEPQAGGGWLGVAVGDGVPQSDPEAVRYADYYQRLSPAGVANWPKAHDMTAQPDPLTGRPLLVTAHELHGIRLFDVSNPAAPIESAKWRGEGMDAPLERVHTVGVFDIGGRRIGIAATETFNDVPPALYIVDFTDLSAPQFLARWVPPGVANDQRILYSLHNFQLVGTRLYLTNFHAGLWVLDLSEPSKPVPTALRTPVRETGYARPDELLSTGAPLNVNMFWDVIVASGYVLVTDMPTGIEVLQVNGDPAGDAAWRGFT